MKGYEMTDNEALLKIAYGLWSRRNMLSEFIAVERESDRTCEYSLCNLIDDTTDLCTGIGCDQCPLYKNSKYFLVSIETAMKWAEKIVGEVEEEKSGKANIVNNAEWRLA